LLLPEAIFLYGNQMTDRWFLVSVCALNVVLRVPLLFLPIAQMSDFGWYFAAARSIAAGTGFAENGALTAFWPVGWPGFLGGLLWAFGPDARVGQLANLVLSTAVIVLIAALGKRLFAENSVWRLAILLIAAYPNQIAYVPLLSVEIFFEFLLLGAFLLLTIPSVRAVLVSGVMFGVAGLTKTQAILLPAALAMPLLAKAFGIRRFVQTAGIASIVMTLVVLPWTARNYTAFQTIIPISTNGGFTLLTGNNPSAKGGYTTDDPLVADLSKDPRNQVAMDRIARDRALHWIEEHPFGFLKLIPFKIWILWSGDGEAEWMYQSGYFGYERHSVLFRAVRVINQIFYWALLGLAAAALPRMWRQRRSLPAWCWSGWAAVGYFTAISAVFSGQSRFHFALMPFIALYAAFTLRG
jgi:hypothetical protein